MKRIDGTEVPLRTPWHRAEQADADPEAAARDPLMHPDGPDGHQGGRVAGDADVDRDRGDSSDAYANVRGSDAEATGRPEIDSVAADPPGHPGEGLGGDASAAEAGAEPGPQVTGTTDDDGEPTGTKTAAEATSTPAGSTGSAHGTGRSGDAEAGARPGAAQAPATPEARGPGTAPAAGSATGHDPRLESAGVAGQGATRAAATEADGAGGTDGGSDAGRRPAGLDAPRGGSADDLKRIRGVGPKLEAQLNGMGYWHYDQIAAWGPAEIAWVDANLDGFNGRVTRDEWVSQAKVLADGGAATVEPGVQ